MVGDRWFLAFLVLQLSECQKSLTEETMPWELSTTHFQVCRSVVVITLCAISCPDLIQLYLV